MSNDPNAGDPQSETRLLEIAQPRPNHNGGRLQFGHDGMLYLSTGDGGGGGDPQGRAQNGGLLLGKILRLDVDPVHGTYAIPSNNPFVGDPNVLDEDLGDRVAQSVANEHRPADRRHLHG